MKQQFILKKINSKQFAANLKKRPFENLENIKVVEDFFRKSRGYVFKMPKPNTPVVLLVSGGLDSTVTWGILLEKYHLKIYPLFIIRDAQKSVQEEKAVEFFTKYFSQKYPGQVYPLMKFTTSLSPKEIINELKDLKKYYHPERMLEMLDLNILTSQVSTNHPQGFLPTLHLFYCLAYINYLYDHYFEKITTIFTGVMAGDGTVLASQSFTSLRNSLLMACSVNNNYQIQYCSLAMEKELGFWFEKKDFIKICWQMGIPLEKTWSCYNYKGHSLQCGDACLACVSRKQSFLQAGVRDQTIYISNLIGFKKKIVNHLKHRIKKFLKIKNKQELYFWKKI
jgi:7-cyano-7-deazaguanine synthase in queuosine biosynthesis